MSKKQKKIPEKGGKKKKAIHDSEYIAYCEHGDSAAVFIMRDIQNTVNVEGKWIDVLSIKTRAENVIKSGWHDFEYFEVELFPKKIRPKYLKDMTDEEKKYETWKTAQEDIFLQRVKGYKGTKYIVFPCIDVQKVTVTKMKMQIVDIILEMFDTETNKWIDCGHGPVPPGRKYQRKEIKKEMPEVTSKTHQEYKILKIAQFL